MLLTICYYKLSSILQFLFIFMFIHDERDREILFNIILKLL